MKIYTRTGDLGETALFGGPRVGKDMARIEACGEVDELNAVLGMVRAAQVSADLDAVLARVQHELFEIGAELATPDPLAHAMRTLGAPHVQNLEAQIDRFDAPLPPLRAFILPGGTPAAAALHLARGVCRRAERRVVQLVRHSEQPISLALLAYLNRLSDLLFVLARWANHQAGQPDIPWQRPTPPASPPAAK